MKKSVLIFLLLLLSFTLLQSQNKHSLNAGVDFSFGLYYFDDDINNPVAYSPFVGYEYSILEFLRLGLGVKYGGFNQKVGYNGNDVISTPPMNPEYLAHDVYRGTAFSPYISSKVIFNIDDSSTPKSVFIGNRFLYTYTHLDTDRVQGISHSNSKNFDFEVKLGYSHFLNKNWSLSYSLGYNTFDFSRVDRKNIKFKNVTPIQIGIEVGYLFR